MLLSRLFRDGQTDGRTHTDGPTTGQGDSSIAPNTSSWGITILVTYSYIAKVITSPSPFGDFRCVNCFSPNVGA